MSLITQIDGVRRLRSHAHVYVSSHFLNEDKPHQETIHILMPLHPKDISRAKITLQALFLRLAHPISGITIVSPHPEALADLCEELPSGMPLQLLKDDDALPAEILEQPFETSAGKSRQGWLRQQFIKLSWPYFIDAQRVLTIDADTKPSKRIRYVDDDSRQFLYTSDEYSAGYFQAVKELIGPIQRAPWSFVAHTMLFDREILKSLWLRIESHTKMPWTRAIPATISVDVSQCFSEFELYGNYAYRMHGDQISLRYFLNKKITEDEFLKTDILAHRRRFRFLSSHLKTR